jgi:fluoride exporter
MTWLLVAVGAAVGAPARYLVNRLVHDFVVSTRPLGFPWGTLAVNLLGSALLGWVLGAEQLGTLGPLWVALLGGGFAGGFTTFSTFAWESDSLVDEGAGALAVAYVTASVVGCLVVASLTWWAATSVAS